MNKTLTLALCLFVAACQSTPEPGEAQEQPAAGTDRMKLSAPDQEAPPTAGEPEPASAQSATYRKIIRNAQLRIRVSNFAESGRAIDQAIRQAGGEIANTNETKSDNSIENALVVRVPAARLDDFLNEVLKQSIFTDTKTITAEDVTRRYVDVEARIRSKRVTEETYLRLLKQAHSVEDVLKVEEQLAKIREEREVEEAELRQLKDEVALSTVNLTYYQQTETALRPEEPFYTQIVSNLADGFRLVGNVLIGLFYLLPLGAIVTGLVWLILRWRRKKNQPKP